MDLLTVEIGNDFTNFCVFEDENFAEVIYKVFIEAHYLSQSKICFNVVGNE